MDSQNNRRVPSLIINKKTLCIRTKEVDSGKQGQNGGNVPDYTTNGQECTQPISARLEDSFARHFGRRNNAFEEDIGNHQNFSPLQPSSNHSGMGSEQNSPRAMLPPVVLNQLDQTSNVTQIFACLNGLELSKNFFSDTQCVTLSDLVSQQRRQTMPATYCQTLAKSSPVAQYSMPGTYVNQFSLGTFPAVNQPLSPIVHAFHQTFPVHQPLSVPIGSSPIGGQHQHFPSPIVDSLPTGLPVEERSRSPSPIIDIESFSPVPPSEIDLATISPSSPADFNSPVSLPGIDGENELVNTSEGTSSSHKDVGELSSRKITNKRTMFPIHYGPPAPRQSATKARSQIQGLMEDYAQKTEPTPRRPIVSREKPSKTIITKRGLVRKRKKTKPLKQRWSSKPPPLPSEPEAKCTARKRRRQSLQEDKSAQAFPKRRSLSEMHGIPEEGASPSRYEDSDGAIRPDIDYFSSSDENSRSSTPEQTNSENIDTSENMQ